MAASADSRLAIALGHWRQLPRAQYVTRILGVAGALAIVAGYVRFLFRYTTEGVFWDEWAWIPMIRSSKAGTLTFGALWLQHNEERMLFPNLIAVGLGRATAMSDAAFVALGAAFLIVAAMLIIVACRAEFARHPLVYLPALLVVFSLAQFENSLWAFQFAWFLIVACICASLLFLTSPRGGISDLVLAAGFGMVGSFSSFQGLTIWPVGLLLLMRPGVSWARRAGWCGAAVVVTGTYMWNLNLTQLGGPPIGEFVHHIPTALRGFLVAAGSVVPDVHLVPLDSYSYRGTMIIGGLITLAGCGVVVAWWAHGRTDRVLAIATGLVVAGLLFDASLMPGRLSAGLINGTVSRYTTFNLLLLTGAYIGAVRTLILALATARRRRIAAGGILAALAAMLVALQSVVSANAGEIGGARTRASHAEAADLTANYANAPKGPVSLFAYPLVYADFQSMAAYLAANRLNVFSSSAATDYVASGVVAGGVVVDPLPVPPEYGNVNSWPETRRAWLALSSVYEQRPDLQAAFPGHSIAASRQMVAWVVLFGHDPGDVVYAPILAPYMDAYVTWASGRS